jgi:N6-L-threonylcarbamoyladenine synthase
MSNLIEEKYTALFGRSDILVLGIESSCDETSASVCKGRNVLSLEIDSQIDLHKQFGGVVPEIASRNHTLNINSVIQSALQKAGKTLDEIELIAVTAGPGLLGSLLVGVSTAKALSFAKNIPLVAVNHIEGHIAACYIGTDLAPPFLACIASGGHTEIVKVNDYNAYERIISTKDDAIGEAFDKVARLLYLPYPGGPNIDKHAQNGQKTINFIKKSMDKRVLSYSGLKTAVLNYLNNARQKGTEINIDDVCCSFSTEAVDMLINALKSAIEESGIKVIAAAGGVAANTFLRESLLSLKDCEVFLPEKILCTDNAAMVAVRGFYMAKKGEKMADLSLDANSVW